jgi:hypothetical protein
MVLLFKSASFPLGSTRSKLETGAIRQPAKAAKIENDLDHFGENVVNRHRGGDKGFAALMRDR